MKPIVILASMMTFGSFAWGISSFFQQPAGRTRYATTLSVLAYFFLSLHQWALFSSNAPLIRWSAGLTIYAASSFIFWMAVRACAHVRLSAIYQPDLPLTLVQGGPYKWIRHPFYLAYSLAWLAGWVVTGNHILLLSIVVMEAGYLMGVRSEEAKFAQSPLREEYESYRRRAGMFLPVWRPTVNISRKVA